SSLPNGNRHPLSVIRYGKRTTDNARRGHTSLDPVLGPPRGVASEMTAAAEITHERECMAQPQLQDLLEAGVHFGHQTRRWNPKMRRFIFAERSGIYIIDLQKTLRQIQKAEELLRSVVLKGEGVLFVCTKKQLKAIVQAEAQTCGAHLVVDDEKEKIAVAEPNKQRDPVVAIVDTNADPDVITEPVPGNDEAIHSVSLLTAALAEVIKEGRTQMPIRQVAEDREAET